MPENEGVKKLLAHDRLTGPVWLIAGELQQYDVLRAGDLNHTHIGKRIYHYGAPYFIVSVYHGTRSSVGIRPTAVGRQKHWRLDPNQEVFVTRKVVK